MNSKDFKAEKTLKKSKSNLKNGGQQIFVLPPNLLQKLGINLGNMGSNPISQDKGRKMSTCVPNLKHGHSSSNTQHEINSVANETSIIKTASLMKESVFLSPTFNTVNNGTNQSEGYGDVCSNNINHAAENCKEAFKEKINGSNVLLESNFLNNKKLEYEHYDRTCDAGLPLENNVVEINECTTSEKCALQNDPKKVINIISEETVTVEKLNELKVLQIPSRNAMIPASLDTIIVKSINKNSVPQFQKFHTVTKSIMDIKQDSGSKHNVINIGTGKVDTKIYDDTEDYCNPDNNEIHVLNVNATEQVCENKDICCNETLSIDITHTELNKPFDNHNSQVNENIDDQIVEKKNEFSTYQNNDGITDNIHVLISNEPDFTENELKSSAPIYQSYSKQVTNNNTNTQSNIVEHVCDNDSEAMINNQCDQNKLLYLPAIHNTNNNNWNQNDLDMRQTEIPKTTTCVHNDQQQTIVSRSRIDIDKLEESKSSLIDTPVQTKNITNNISVNAQGISLQIVDNATISLIEDLKSTIYNSFTGIVDDEGISKLSLPLNPKRNNLMSKLCIQGVEKPGGITADEKRTVALKTYSINKRNKVPKIFLSPQENISQKKIDDKCNIDLSGTNTIDFLLCERFCKCSDYGILDYKQIGNDYEHIHYSWNRPLDCSPNLVFDIYDDNEIIRMAEITKNFDHIETNIDLTDSGCSEHPICWYNADTVQNKFHTDFEDFQNQENMSHTYSQANEKNLKDHSMSIHGDDIIESNIDYKIETSIVTQHDLEVNSDVNTSPDVMKSEARKETDKNNFLNIPSKDNNNLQSKKISRKRKMSNNRNEVSDSKKVKNNQNNEHKSSAEKAAKSDQKDKKDSDSGFKGWKGTDKVRNNVSKQQQVKCAVCGISVINTEWTAHIASSHDYVAWKEGEPPVDLQNDDAIRDHLHQLVQELGHLKCSRCGLTRKYTKPFLHHIKICDSSSDVNFERPPPYLRSKTPDGIKNDHCGNRSRNSEEFATYDRRSIRKSVNRSDDKSEPKDVTCGVCKQEVSSQEWITHMQREHCYKAWREGESPLNFEDEVSIRKHLYKILQLHGPLVCSKCGKSRKYVKMFLRHIEVCTGPKDQEEAVDTSCLELESILDTSLDDTGTEGTELVKCGVCHLEMESKQWFDHTQKKHNYLGWQEGKTPLNLRDEEVVRRFLYILVQKLGSLVCGKCGAARKYVKSYLSHIKSCMGPSVNDGNVPIEDENSTLNDTVSDSDEALVTYCTRTDEVDSTKVVKCAVCDEEMEERHWIEHIQKQHNYLAWQDGDKPLNLEDKELIRSHLKSIALKIGRLTCTKCGLRRRKVKPFYNHIKICDGTPESLESLESKLQIKESGKMAKCAVCHTEVPAPSWTDHIAKEHDYMAWREDEEPLDINDEASVSEHLNKISQNAGMLICSKCGQRRKYVKSYLQHIQGCTGPQESTDDESKALKSKVQSSENVTCALCRKDMNDTMWMEHIAREHNYISWKQNDPPLVFEDETSLRDYLYNIVQSTGSLVCSKCGLVRKYAKGYLLHIESCQKVTWKRINKMITKLNKEKGDIVRCALCYVEVDDTEWIEHIANQHNYLAWRDRDPPLNLEDEIEVRNHLKIIIEDEGYLKCPKCKVHRKYAKLYLQHVNTCDGSQEENFEMNESIIETQLQPKDSGKVDTDDSVEVKCGVCALQVTKAEWFEHIQKEHKYLAWQEGKEPIDLNDKEAVNNHLSTINMKCKGLKCSSCGAVRKYVKAYLHHVRVCSERNYAESNEIIECGVCGEKMVGKLWRDHAMNMHYNVAWVAGESPIDLRSFVSVDKYLKEYHEYKHKLVCNICGLSRASLAGFYAHVLVCGKTEQEANSWKDVCDICNQKYICIYKTQHYWMHKVQEVSKERKFKVEIKKVEEINEEINYTPGRRRAAEKARTVLEDYAAKVASNKCRNCDFESENKEDLASHECSKRSVYANADSDDSVSIKLEDYSEEESEATDVDSNLSNEEEESILFMETKKRIKREIANKLTTKTAKFPFVVRDVKPYLHDSKLDHFKMLYTRKTLFTHWRNYSYEVVSDELIPQYMPQLEESCKVTISNGSWETYKRFESKKEKGCTVLFTGGCIQCISWAPEHPDSTPACPSVLAVATHRGPDCPRLECTDTPSHPALIQIWNFNDFKSLPKLAFGLAHDYGTVWAMDWCPSGARDMLDGVDCNDKDRPRLGLLAMACSNGSAYVVTVPYPDTNQVSDIPFYKIKPCVELRVTRGSNKYQATSINWSLFKGYTTISVGYGDGTLAFYDLATESPLLTAKQGDINILYPFQDERVHNSCVTGVTSCVLGAWCSSSVTGSTAGVAGAAPRGGRGARPVRAHSGLAASVATFMPHWPNVMLSGDDTIVGLSPSELEWGYVGRRVGSLRALAPCVRRARVAAVVPPLLQVMRLHPAAFKGHKAIHKKNVAMLEMTPLAKKRSKHYNDEFSMKLEPMTYEDAIASYGIEFKFEKDFDKASLHRVQQKHRVPYPERFPLADVPALAYCPAAAHYTKLALAAHCGLIFLLDV